jgi:hypothetical protein
MSHPEMFVGAPKFVTINPPGPVGLIEHVTNCSTCWVGIEIIFCVIVAVVLAELIFFNYTERGIRAFTGELKR